MFASQHPVISQKGDLLLLKSGEYADVKVSFHGITLHLHRCILSRCSWFKDKLATFHYNDGIEIKIVGFSPSLIRTLIRFIYTAELCHEDLRPDDDKFDYKLHAELYNMGTFFKLPDFKAALVDMGVNYLSKDIRGYKKRPRKFPQAKIDRLLAAVWIAYSSTAADQAPSVTCMCASSRSASRAKAGKEVMTIPMKTIATEPVTATSTKPATTTAPVTTTKPVAANKPAKAKPATTVTPVAANKPVAVNKSVVANKPVKTKPVTATKPTTTTMSVTTTKPVAANKPVKTKSVTVAKPVTATKPATYRCE
ncbi:hypothetical protein PG988_013808 [Apiospora saccharicola]